MRRRSMSTATRVTSSSFSAVVVTDGVAWRVHRPSSNAVTERSCGTRSPRSAMWRFAIRAITSFTNTSAVGRSGARSISLIRAAQSSVWWITWFAAMGHPARASAVLTPSRRSTTQRFSGMWPTKATRRWPRAIRWRAEMPATSSSSLVTQSQSSPSTRPTTTNGKRRSRSSIRWSMGEVRCQSPTGKMRNPSARWSSITSMLRFSFSTLRSLSASRSW